MTIEDRGPRIVCDIGIQTKEVASEDPTQSTVPLGSLLTLEDDVLKIVCDIGIQTEKIGITF
jgi:hypothetical protein